MKDCDKTKNVYMVHTKMYSYIDANFTLSDYTHVKSMIRFTNIYFIIQVCHCILQ